MTIEEIKKNAPKGATHYDFDLIGSVIYYVNDGGHWMAFDDEGVAWNLFSGDFEWYSKNAKPL